jgi:hypothetical protein
MLNENLDWTNVRYQVGRRTSYDVHLSFKGTPDKQELPTGTLLYRLDFPVVFGMFMKSWWMKEDAFRRVFSRSAASPTGLRQEWQNSLSMKKPGKGGHGQFGGRTGEAGTRTQVIVIRITQPVMAWVGVASPLFNKAGGEEQVFLPNLAKGSGPNRSEYAALARTYTLPA